MLAKADELLILPSPIAAYAAIDSTLDGSTDGSTVTSTGVPAEEFKNHGAGYTKDTAKF